MRSSLLFLALLSTVPLAAQSIVREWNVPPIGRAFPGGIAYDPINDTIWVVDETDDHIRQFDRAGALKLDKPAPIPMGSGITDPNPIGCCVDPTTGNLWVVVDGPIRWAYELQPDGATIARAFSIQQLVDASAIAMDPVTGTLWIADDSAAALFEFRPDGMQLGSINVSGAGANDPDGLAYDPVTRTFFIGDDLTDRIIQVDRTGKKVKEWSLVALGISPEGLDLDVRSASLFVGDTGSQRRLVELSGILAPCMATAVEYGPRMCQDSGGTEIGLASSSCPSINNTLAIGMTTSPTVTTPATFIIATQRLPAIDLRVLNAPVGKCFLVAGLPIIVISPIPVKNGRAVLPLPIPDDPTLAGLQLTLQGLLYPHNGSIASTNGIELTLR